MVQNLKKQMDGWFGPPGEALKTITELSNSLANIDMAKVKELRTMVGALGTVQIQPDELRLVTELVKMLCGVDIEMIREFRQLIINLTQLVRLLPKDVPVAEILQAVRSEIKQ